MYIALSILTLLSAMSAVIFYSGCIAYRSTLRKCTEEYNSLKKELEFTKFQVDTLCKEVSEEKNKNLVMESLLNQYKK